MFLICLRESLFLFLTLLLPPSSSSFLAAFRSVFHPLPSPLSSSLGPSLRSTFSRKTFRKKERTEQKNGSRKLETYRGSHQTPPNLFGTAKNNVVLINNCFATFRREGKNGEFVLCTGIGAPSFARRLSSRQLGKVSHFEGRRRRLPHHTKAETQRRGVLPSREKHCGSLSRLRCQNSEA